ncbi:S9 family peptidase [Corynebacterium caspium]|uniref:S9 family peptidase n=1 Tax=Corynebacterium caspium TaxID=234828 RepID=UPI00036156B5|nr:S9 family peptidase [Corynebacterium caspium]WKD58736.1 Protease 2 [Corynebacterium caspium DSM 44850]
MNSALNPPIAPAHPISRIQHGRTFIDNYEWLREKENPETIAYLEAENKYCEALTAPLAELKADIYAEIKSRTKQTDMSVPSRAGNWWYYGRTEEGKDYGFSCRVAVTEGTDPWVAPTIPENGAIPGEELLLDLNELAAGHDFFALGASTVTVSGRYLAYSTDTQGDERFTAVIKDLHTGELLEDRLEGLFYGLAWAGEEYIFYTTVDEAWRPDTVWRHKIGTPQSADVQVFHEPDGRFNVGIGSTRSEKYLFIEAGSKLTTEVHALPIATPTAEFQVLWPREKGVEYSIDHAIIEGVDRWLITHNAHGPNFCVSESPAFFGTKLPVLRDTNILVAHHDDIRIEGIDAYANHLVLGYRAGAIPRASIMLLAPGYTTFQEISFDEELYSVGVVGNPEWDAPVIRVAYSSFTTPSRLYDYWVATGERTLLKSQEVLGGYNRDDYIAYRRFATAPDGTQIPISIVHRADLDTTQPNPMLLYAYGSYEASIDPGFSIARLSLMDRGLIFAIAHVRGGGEMGRGWYDHGKMLEKRNTFLDFIAVAEDLIAAKITAPEKLVAEGGSAGGLLMGAIANMAPHLFAGIQAVVPFVDPLTSMLKPELPLTITEWDEWGDPLHDPQVYDYMASYAPYENINNGAYPDILAITSLNDTRVLYVEPAKWIAQLRATAASGTFALQTEMSAGHGGVSGRYKQWEQTAFEYAWTIDTATNGRLAERS